MSKGLRSAQPAAVQLFLTEQLQVGKPGAPITLLQCGRRPAVPSRGKQLRVSHLHKTKQSLTDLAHGVGG